MIVNLRLKIKDENNNKITLNPVKESDKYNINYFI